jgi:hypothetical protein
MNDPLYKKWFDTFGNTPRPIMDFTIQPAHHKSVVDQFQFTYNIDLLEKINKLEEEVKRLKKQIKDKQ